MQSLARCCQCLRCGRPRLQFSPHFSEHCIHLSPYSSYAERSELEPIISAEIMELHHKKHHQTYINALNTAAEKFAEVRVFVL